VAVVKYAHWREHEIQRVQTNDTVMGLLAGSKLAAQVLNLTAGSTLALSQIFPSVEHIERFNLRAERARQVLEEAENLLGILAVPQIIALHEDLFQGMSQLLVAEGLMTTEQAESIKAANMHSVFESAAAPPRRFTPVSVELFHLIRVARNAHVHSGGRANSALLNRVQNVSTNALSAWRRITGESFSQYSPGAYVRLGLVELIGTLAVTQRLAEEANVMLQSAIPTSRWADMLIEDWAPNRKPGNRKQWLRKILGLARMNYGPVGFVAQDIEEALDRAGL
jgi:hypothetical protein